MPTSVFAVETLRSYLSAAEALIKRTGVSENFSKWATLFQQVLQQHLSSGCFPDETLWGKSENIKLSQDLLFMKVKIFHLSNLFLILTMPSLKSAT